MKKGAISLNIVIVLAMVLITSFIIITIAFNQMTNVKKNVEKVASCGSPELNKLYGGTTVCQVTSCVNPPADHYYEDKGKMGDCNHCCLLKEGSKTYSSGWFVYKKINGVYIPENLNSVLIIQPTDEIMITYKPLTIDLSKQCSFQVCTTTCTKSIDKKCDQLNKLTSGELVFYSSTGSNNVKKLVGKIGDKEKTVLVQ